MGRMWKTFKRRTMDAVICVTVFGVFIVGYAFVKGWLT
jgi:hypothetical protein